MDKTPLIEILYIFYYKMDKPLFVLDTRFITIKKSLYLIYEVRNIFINQIS
jgi:hypothetical protein